MMDLPDVSESGGIQKITDDKEQVLIPVPYLWEKSRYPPLFSLPYFTRSQVMKEFMMKLQEASSKTGT
jgi:hypothetical protein